jgi:uncharacterized Zn-finger protein
MGQSSNFGTKRKDIPMTEACPKCGKEIEWNGNFKRSKEKHHDRPRKTLHFSFTLA